MSDGIDMVLLGRIQFAFTIAFHITLWLWTGGGCGTRRLVGARLLPLLPIPVLVVLSFWRLVRTLVLKKTYAPHLWSIGLFLLVSIYPYLVPYQLTIHEAAAAPNSQRLLLVGAVILLPLILGYTAYVHWIFRGKVKADAGYH